MKLKAGTLFIVLIVALIIGILMSSLILFAYYNRLRVFEHLLYERLELNVNSGINILLSQKDLLEKQDSIVYDLYEEGDDSIKIVSKPWGLFKIAKIEAFAGVHTVSKIFQYGYSVDSTKNMALYLTDQDRPLSIAGNTLIKGNAYLPPAGIRTTYIEGQGFKKEQLVEGKIKTSNKKPFPVNVTLIKQLYASLTSDSLTLVKGARVLNGIGSDSLRNSFEQKTLIVRLSKNHLIVSPYISGNIILISKKPIKISARSKINDALVFAPAIEIETGFKGCLQAFVTDSVKIGKKCSLSYPSVLGLIKKDSSDRQPFIAIGSGSLIEGVVFTHSQKIDLKQTRIELQKEARVEGQVYSDGFLEMLGNVYGTVYCNRFLLKTPITYYENHLLNVTIDRSRLSKYYIGSMLLPDGKQKKIVKWLP